MASMPFREPAGCRCQRPGSLRSTVKWRWKTGEQARVRDPEPSCRLEISLRSTASGLRCGAEFVGKPVRVTTMIRKFLVSAPLLLAPLLSACQTAQVNAPGTAMAAVEKQAEAEAIAFGATQGAIGAAAAFDPTGLSSLPTMAAGRAAHRAWMTSVQARTRATQEVDLQAEFKKYGMNPDGTPSGVPGPGSATP